MCSGAGAEASGSARRLRKHDPGSQAAARAIEIAEKGAPTGAQLGAALAQIDAPLLLIFARHDRVVPLDTLDYIWARVASADKQQVILEHGGHIVTEDYDKEFAFAAIDRFLQQHS